MLRWRLILGTLLIAALIGLAWLDYFAPLPGLWLMPVAILLAILSAAELIEMINVLGMKPAGLTIYGGIVLILLSNWISYLHTNVLDKSPDAWANWDLLTAPIAWPLIILIVYTIVIFINEMYRFQKSGQAMINISASIFALVYVGLFLSFLVQIRMIWGIGAMASLIIVVKMGDIGAYLVGRLIGRHKLTPVLSPGKTVEGGFGAILFACLGAWLSFRFLIPSLSTTSMTSAQGWLWIPYGISLGVAGILGDLAESLIKRDAGKKDSSTWLPGFGGVLDILDSLLFAAPVGWLFWVLHTVI
jgi:phosphatidate cytidylyltransferase